MARHWRRDATHWVAVGHGFDLLVVLGLGQQSQPVRVKFAARWIESAPICSAEVGPEGVDCDDEGPSVRLKLQHTQREKGHF